MKTVPLEEESIKEYLDNAIIHWRGLKKKVKNKEEELMAICYIDAYQSVRVSLFERLLPKEGSYLENVYQRRDLNE